MNTGKSLRAVAVLSRIVLLAVAGFAVSPVQQVAAEAVYVGLELVPMTFDVSSNRRLPFSQTIDTVDNSATGGSITTTVVTTDHQMNGGTASFAPMTLRARLGLTILPDLFPIISLESHLGFDVSEDKQTVSYTEYTETSTRVDSAAPVIINNVSPDESVNTAVRLDNYIGLYARADFPIIEQARVHLLLGWASAQFAGVGRYGLPDDDTESSISYSVGGDYQLPWDMKGFFEYTQIISGSHYDVRGFGLGVTIEIK